MGSKKFFIFVAVCMTAVFMISGLALASEKKSPLDAWKPYRVMKVLLRQGWSLVSVLVLRV